MQIAVRDGEGMRVTKNHASCSFGYQPKVK